MHREIIFILFTTTTTTSIGSPLVKKSIDLKVLRKEEALLGKLEQEAKEAKKVLEESKTTRCITTNFTQPNNSDKPDSLKLLRNIVMLKTIASSIKGLPGKDRIKKVNHVGANVASYLKDLHGELMTDVFVVSLQSCRVPGSTELRKFLVQLLYSLISFIS